jgi:hypothetical protein
MGPMALARDDCEGLYPALKPNGLIPSRQSALGKAGRQAYSRGSQRYAVARLGIVQKLVPAKCQSNQSEN